MKIKLNYTLILALALVSNAQALTNRAVKIDISGIGPAVDVAAFDTVKQVIGSAVSTGMVDQFNVKGYGIEGGFSACVEASPFTKDIAPLVKQLRTIKPNPKTTTYSIKPALSCNEDPIFCPQDAMICPDGQTFVGRVPPSCDFAPCPVK